MVDEERSEFEGKEIWEEEVLEWEEDEWEEEKAMEEREPGACVDEVERAFWRSAVVKNAREKMSLVRSRGRCVYRLCSRV